MDTTYLTQRGRQYHLRVRVPSDLVSLIGRQEIQRSLRTDDPRLARSMARTLRATLDTAFGTLRHQRMLNLPADQLQSTLATLLMDQLPTTHLRRLPSGARPGATGDVSPARLSDLIQTFVSDRRNGWEPKTLLMHSAALRLFVEIVGDRPIEDLTRDDCRAFRDTLAKLPPNMSKRFRGKSIAQVAALNEAPMAPKNANKNLAVISAFLNWARDERFIADNPAKGLRIAIRGRADSERDAFGPDDLRLLFERSPLYTGCASADRRDRPGSLIIRDARYWLPLIALYSGMRAEEIAQLEVADVQQIGEIWVFDVNADEGKKLKTAHSRRLVPVHSALIRLGLLDYAAGLRAKGETRLWPDLRRGNDGFYSSPFSKWFGRYKRKIGIANRKVTFHSLRHTVIDYLKQQDVADVAIKELVGHAVRDITTGRYGKRLALDKLQAVLERLHFSLVDPVS
jgi:integrase